ncbi:ImmA/IrrE family metallo-endopeptidase [Gordonia sp. HY285]|uniref:ImmA/IrrE family metallo-endopeptidase n=1 Tax=Gordonia liuliyuniae TaxID=2911517 RepID=UPI001F2FBABE|nr:ImmA/IrrE family metallo-endopeptidase [Gordonia liuliyuniae]MCF8609994.1 ImmA/IrrE family metallo-endopeptidase [Gordonia liuliyuniae]
MMYHPWRDARDRLPDVDIVFVDHLPDGQRGQMYGDRIEINARLLSSAERRCTLAHELVHHERGPTPSDSILLAREEALVERTAARRLIALDQLIDALRWTRHAPEVADELWVDVPMLTAFVESLSPDELAVIATALDDDAEVA